MMIKRPDTQSHRFVLVFRNEAREVDGAPEVWRGWIERIPNPRQREIDRQADDRIDFQNLEDLPRPIRRLMDRSQTPAARI